MSGLQPSAGMRCLFPQRFALGWIKAPFQGFCSNQRSAISGANNSTIKQLNESTNKQLNISTPEEHIRAESPDYFSPIPQGWGIDIRTLFGGLKAWMKFIMICSIAESGFNLERSFGYVRFSGYRTKSIPISIGFETDAYRIFFSAYRIFFDAYRFFWLIVFVYRIS